MTLRILIILTILLLQATYSFAQNFTLNDTVFQVGEVLRTYEISFELDKATLRPQSIGFLDSLTTFLIENEDLQIEISNHTDERWSDKFSTCLTCIRAKSIRDYLIDKGVAAERLIAKGYNDLRPIIANAKTEDEHQVNRRTEFMILSIE